MPADPPGCSSKKNYIQLGVGTAATKPTFLSILRLSSVLSVGGKTLLTAIYPTCSLLERKRILTHPLQTNPLDLWFSATVVLNQVPKLWKAE